MSINVKKILAYVLIGGGLLGCFFLLRYNGSAIPVRELWFVLSFFVFVTGCYIIAKDKIARSLATEPYTPIPDDKNLVTSGIKIRLTLDNCEIKTRSFQQEIVPDPWPSRMEMIDGIANPERNYKTKGVEQTYLVYECLLKGVPHKFVSHPTSMSAVSARKLLDERGGLLYIDKGNPARYYFDLPF